MAQKVVTQLVDDLDQTVLSDGQGETIAISLDGASYEIDLSHKNAARLRSDLGKWLDHARKVPGSSRGRRGRPTPTVTRDYNPKAVRKWAASHKINVPARGRIPADVIEKFKAAGN